MTRKQRIGAWSAVLLVLLVVADMGLILFRDTDRPVADDSQRYGFSDFYRVAGVVHARVLGAGLVALRGADPASFAPIESDQPGTRHLGRDQRQVYCGSQSLPGLDPARTQYLGQGYLGDGRHAYFCGPRTVANPAQQGWAGFWQAQRHAWGLGERRQSHHYPWVRLPEGDGDYRALDGQYLVTDGHSVYHAGRRLPDADPASIRQLPLRRAGRDHGPSDYFADARHVYYQGEKLALAANPSLYVVRVEGAGAPETLIDPIGHGAYTGALAFDPALGPYQPLAASGASLNHMLLAGREGIYYADPVRAAVALLAPVRGLGGNWQQLAPRLATDGTQTWLLYSGTEWIRRGRQGGRVVRERWTRLMRVEEGAPGPWQPLGTVRQALGEVWRHGQHDYFLVGDRGSAALQAPLYRIADEDTRQWLQDTSLPPLTDRAFRARLESGQLTPASLVEVATAHSVLRHVGPLALAALAFGVLLLGLLMRHVLWQRAGWRGRPLMSVRDGKLYVGNLLRVFYSLSDVSKVEIRYGEGRRWRGGGAGFSVTAAGKTHRYTVAGGEGMERLQGLQQMLVSHRIRVVPFMAA